MYERHAADPRLANKSDAHSEFLGWLERVLQPLEDEIGDGDPTGLMADALAEDSRDAELAVRDLVFGKLRHLLGGSFERLDDHDPSVKVDGVLFHRAEPTTGRAMSVFGPIEYQRGKSVLPTEAVLGIGDGGTTAAAKELSLLHQKRGSRSRFKEFRRRMRKLVTHDAPLDYAVIFDAERDVVTFRRLEGSLVDRIPVPSGSSEIELPESVATADKQAEAHRSPAQ